MSKIIGIDLGTTNSCVSVMEGNDAVVITNSEGKRTTPSIIGFLKDERKIGDPAKRQMATNSDTIFSIKRFMGKKFSEINKRDLEGLPYNVVDNNGNCAVKINDRVYTPQEISAMVLQKMKKTAEDYLGTKVERAVITVPAYFNDQERQATKEAGEIAGLKVERIINEPTAAALAYGIDKEGDKTIAVFDAGGGTFDISILEIGDGVFEVKSTNGDTRLGGDDIDQTVINWIVDEFKKEHNVDLKSDKMAMQRIKEAAEKAKIELSSSSSTEINLPYIIPVDGIPQHIVKTLTRSEFEKMIDDIIERFKQPCHKAIKDSGISVDKIDEIILVGGTTRIPIIKKIVKDIFGKDPSSKINPDEAVAIGAAIQGGVLSGDVNDVLLLDVTPLSLGLETMGGVMTRLIEANTTIPVSKSQIFTTAIDNQPTVEVHVLQGERPMAKDNKTLGRFHLDNIPPSPRGIPQIEISFDIDANGILNVKATDKGTGKEQKIRIEGSSNLDNSEIERMKNEAKMNEENDRKIKEEIDFLNEADSLVFQTEKQLKDFQDKITEDDRNKLISKKDELKKEIENKNIDKIKDLKKEIESIWHNLSSKIYGNTSNENSNNSDVSDVSDVEFEEVK